MRKSIALCLLNLMSLALCTTTITDQSEPRKTSVRSASAVGGASSHLNSLQSSQDSIGKQQQQAIQQQIQQQQQQSGNGQSYTHVSPNYSSITQPHSTIYTQLQTGQSTSPTGGYFISVNPQNSPSAALGPAPTPVIMQYLPHNAQTGAIQYLQLIPTRPLLVPISPYISPYNNPYSQSQSGPAPQASTNTPYAALPHHHHSSYTPTTSHSYGNSYQPTIQSPIGGYSTNYLTYFRPNHGMQLVNGPMDLSLNTNEYIPLQSENSYKVRRARSAYLNK